jgi:Arc/MetJ-type ribon-helix-helix transcriptional regulator
MTTEHMVILNAKVENSLTEMIESIAYETGLNKSELVRSCLRFALGSEEFRMRIKSALDEADRLVLESLGDASITIRTLVRRLNRRTDVIMEHPSAAWLSVVRLKCPVGESSVVDFWDQGGAWG